MFLHVPAVSNKLLIFPILCDFAFVQWGDIKSESYLGDFFFLC